MQSRVGATLKRTRAVELAAQGKSFTEIAQAVGYSHRGSAHRAVYKALEQRQIDAVDELRTLELARLDRLHRAAWELAVTGDLAAIETVLRIMDQRDRLLGLYPTKTSCQREHLELLVRTEGNPGEATARPDGAEHG